MVNQPFSKSANRQSGFGHVLGFLLLVMVLVAVAGIGMVVFKKSKSAQSVNFHSAASETASKMADCTGKQLLQQSPVQPDQISQIIPLGNLAPPGHVLPTFHMYYNYLHTGSHPVRTTLYVPANMTITQMMKMDNADLPTPYISYRLDFAICKQVTGYFILVQTLNDKLAAAMQPPYDRTQTSDVGRSTVSHNWYKNVNVQLKAGDILGYAGGNAGDPDGLDMAIIDTRQPLPTLANAKHWESSDEYYACSLDYYAHALSQQLYAKLGDYYGRPVADSTNKCGSVYQDTPGTAQGVWMSSDAQGMWDVHSLAGLVHSNFDPGRGAFSFGSKAGQAGINTSYVNYFTPAKTGTVNLDFSLVKPGPTIYCYQVDNGAGQTNSQATILLQLSTTKLTVGAGPATTCGGGPWTFSQSVDYVR